MPWPLSDHIRFYPLSLTSKAFLLTSVLSLILLQYALFLLWNSGWHSDRPAAVKGQPRIPVSLSRQYALSHQYAVLALASLKP